MIDVSTYKAGRKEKSLTGYSYFVPSPVNDAWNWDDASINKLLERAAIKVGELNSYSQLVPNIDLFVQLHAAKEAVISSKIEGTQTQMDEALMEEDEINLERRDDWQEVKNYQLAMNEAVADLDCLPISSRLLRKTHARLLEGARGQNKMPGEFRTSQNWIGGSSLANATFVPPHQGLLAELMGDLEKFIHNEEVEVPDLIKIAIAHYQFETIHPFLDGNGRMGRLLITLFLIDKKILSAPLLYLSVYFEKNRALYYDQLTLVRTENRMDLWIKYFLRGLAETAEHASDTLLSILEMKARLEQEIKNDFGRRTSTALCLLQYLLEKPLLSVNKASGVTGLSYNAANTLLADFSKAGILKERTGYGRNRVFEFEEYLNLFTGS